MRQHQPLWPRILQLLDLSPHGMQCSELARLIGANEKSVYASMSSMRRASRFYVRPHGNYRRDAVFEITDRGRKRLEQYRCGKDPVLIGIDLARRPDRSVRVTIKGGKVVAIEDLHGQSA